MINVELGKSYILNNGDRITIVEVDKFDDVLPFLSDTGYWYTPNGKTWTVTPREHLIPFDIKEIA